MASNEQCSLTSESSKLGEKVKR